MCPALEINESDINDVSGASTRPRGRLASDPPGETARALGQQRQRPARQDPAGIHRDGSGARPLIAFTAFGQQRGDMGNRRRSTAPLSRIRWKASAMSRICGPSTVTEDDELEIMARPIGRKVFNCHHETTGIRSTQLIPAKPGRHPDRTDRRSPRHQDHRRRADRRRPRDGQPVAPNHPRIPKDTPAPGFAALLTIRLHLSLLQGVGIE